MFKSFQPMRSRRTKQRSSQPVVLIGEDHDDSRSMMRALLEMKGYKVEEAQDGQQVIDLARLHCPTLILLDFTLPGLNGVETTRQLRRNEATSFVPIIMVSGWDDATHETMSLTSGCNEYLLKPIDFERLNAALHRYAPLNSTQSSTPRFKTASH